MLLSDIKIPEDFLASQPRQSKIQDCATYYAQNGALDRDIILDSDGFLVDGYIGYLVLLANGVAEVDAHIVKGKPQHYWKHPTTYVFARHFGCDAEFVWRITRQTRDVQNLKPGNHILANTKYGPMKVLVTRIETLLAPPVKQSIKKVIRCFSE